MSNTIPISSRFKATCVHINSIPENKFPHLLKRILTKLHLPSSSYFTPEEEEQLCSVLSLSSANLSDVLGACSYAFSQAAFYGLKTESLSTQMQSAGMSPSAATALSSMWASEGPAVTRRLRDAHSMGGPAVLAGTEWSLGISLGQSTLSRTKEACARFDFDLDDDGEKGRRTTTSVEFSHQELYDFFTKLELVQQQLDALS